MAETRGALIDQIVSTIGDLGLDTYVQSVGADANTDLIKLMCRTDQSAMAELQDPTIYSDEQLASMVKSIDNIKTNENFKKSRMNQMVEQVTNGVPVATVMNLHKV